MRGFSNPFRGSGSSSRQGRRPRFAPETLEGRLSPSDSGYTPPSVPADVSADTPPPPPPPGPDGGSELPTDVPLPPTGPTVPA